MKHLLAIVLAFACMATAASAQRISILGDSYSTFEGYVSPEWNFIWYAAPGSPSHQRANNVSSVEQTWWHMLAANHGLTVEKNNSFSGATICQTGYDGEDYSDRSFISRIGNLGSPELIIIFGGTNDSWAHSPIGEDKFEHWRSEDLYSFRPAFALLMHKARALYPDALIINVTNSELGEDITSAMVEICRRYDVPNVMLHDIDKQWGHPSQAGMKAIEAQVWSAIAPLLQ